MDSPRFPPRLLLPLVLLLALASLSTGPAQGVPAHPAQPPGGTAAVAAPTAVTFSDEFDGPAV